MNSHKPFFLSCHERDKLAIMLINNNYIVGEKRKIMKKSRINRYSFIWALKLRTNRATRVSIEQNKFDLISKLISFGDWNFYLYYHCEECDQITSLFLPSSSSALRLSSNSIEIGRRNSNWVLINCALYKRCNQEEKSLVIMNCRLPHATSTQFMCLSLKAEY